MSFVVDVLPKEIRDKVKAVDKGDHIEIQHGYIEDKEVFSEIYDIITQQFHGRYFGYYDGAAHYEIAKSEVESQTEVRSERSVEKPSLEETTEFKKASELRKEESKEYDIKESIQKVGHLYPVLKDAYGNVIDGFHRQKEDPNWPVKKLGHITDPVQLAIARVVANVCRRDVPPEEKTEWLRQIASLTGWSAKEIAEHLPVKYSWVMKYLPSEFKDKEKAVVGAKGGRPALRRKAEFDKRGVAEWIRCEGETCNVLTPGFEFEGKRLCSKCFQKATGHSPPKKPPRVIEAPKPKPETKVTKLIHKPPEIKESWPNRVARMHPQVSRMEEAVFLALNEKGVNVQSQEEFCVKSTRPDFYFPKQRLAVYLDGEQVHKHPEKDEALRELLTKHHGIRVLSLTYSSFTKEQQEEILSQIMEEIG